MSDGRCLRCGEPADVDWLAHSSGLCGSCLADDALVPLTRILAEPPDIAGPGQITCTCGHFKVSAKATPGLSVVTQCPHCGRVIEPWEDVS